MATWRFRFPRSVWMVAAALACVTSLPYVAGWLNTPEGWGYSGAVPVHAGFQVDYNSHLAKMWQGSRGDWDYQLLFTHEPHEGIVLVQGFYVALGALARLTPFSLPLVYHVARFALTIGMVVSIWAFASRYFDRPLERWISLLFGVVVGGMGWMLFLVAPNLTRTVAPIEFWLTDAYNLLGAFYMPHFAAAVTLQVVAFLTLDTLNPTDAGTKQARRFGILTLSLAGLSLIQPYILLLSAPLIGVVVAYRVWVTHEWPLRWALRLALPVGVHAGLVLYQYVMLNTGDVWRGFSQQNVTASPSPIYYLLGYLPFFIPMIFGIGGLRKDVTLAGMRLGKWLLPLAWVLLVALLLYAPFPTQRRYLLGAQTPLAVLAAAGWIRFVLPRLSRSRGRLLTTVYIGFGAVAPLLMIVSNVGALTRPQPDEHLFYRPDEMAAYAWMRENATPGDLTLTTFDWTGKGSGGRLVAATGQRVFLGHWIETASFDAKIASIRQFYDVDTDDRWRQAFISETGTVYIWYDSYARQYGDWSPAGVDWLDEEFTSAEVRIYRVMMDHLQAPIMADSH